MGRDGFILPVTRWWRSHINMRQEKQRHTGGYTQHSALCRHHKATTDPLDTVAFYNMRTAATDVLTGVDRTCDLANVKRHLWPSEFCSNHDRLAPKAVAFLIRQPACGF